MTLQKAMLMLFLLPILASGCAHKAWERDRMMGQIHVFGIELYSAIDYKELNGVVPTEEPCLRGYERSFDALDIIIGYGFDKRIRKITTRNTSTSMFGIIPGMTLDEGREMVLQAGFREYIPPFTYRADGYSLKLLVDGDNRIFGLTLETLD